LFLCALEIGRKTIFEQKFDAGNLMVNTGYCPLFVACLCVVGTLASDEQEERLIRPLCQLFAFGISHRWLFNTEFAISCMFNPQAAMQFSNS